jgi:ATP-dependent helicase/nuclease subunit A
LNDLIGYGVDTCLPLYEEMWRRLLAQPGMGEWVRYKLDQRTDHILVDEAQDTNAAQWDIVRALAEEFFTGSPETEGRARTLFMVGDFKQAIYGFQGTDPREFDKMRSEVRARADALSGEDSALEFHDLSPRQSIPFERPRKHAGRAGAAPEQAAAGQTS